MEINYKQTGSLPYKYRRSASSNVHLSMASNVGRNVFERVFTVTRALQVTVQGCLSSKASF